MSPEVEQIVAILDQAYNRTSWHGTNLRGSLRRVTPAQAAWRPAPGRHNIWEIMVHAAYWKYAVARRFTGGARGSFPLKGSNWFRRPAESGASIDTDWKADLELLDRMHDALRAAVVRLSAKDLPRTPPGKKVSNFALLSGVAAHDLYHAGQIQLLKRLAPL
jgi:DinB superfamily